MARKVEKAAANDATAGASPAVDTLAALTPDRTLTIAGREVVVREYEFFEGLAVAHQLAGFIADLSAGFSAGELRYASVRRLIGVHREQLLPAIAMSAGVDRAWIEALDAEDKEMLISAWFGVHGSFFVREATVDLLEQKRRLAPPTGSKSLPN